MKSSIRFLLAFNLLITFGCAFSTAQKSTSCSPPGTVVSFSKLVTPGFAQDYVGCDVSTVAQFVAPGAGAFLVPASDGKIVFRVLPPGIAGEKNPLSGEIQANFVVISKAAGKNVYNLMTGDLIRISGGNYVQSLSSFSKLINGGGDYNNIVFEATSIVRLDSKKEPKKKIK